MMLRRAFYLREGGGRAVKFYKQVNKTKFFVTFLKGM